MTEFKGALLQADDPPAFTILNPDAVSPFLLTCEHAGIAIPSRLGRLGLEAEDFTRHYAFDIGIRRVAETLAARLGAPAVLGNYSRLVADLNRAEDSPGVCAESGEGKPIPGNIHLSATEKQARLREIYHPYGNALDKMLDRATVDGRCPMVISIHSFTRRFFNFERPWQLGFLWAHDDRIARFMFDYYSRQGYQVGDNLPYDHRILRGSAINRFADPRRLPNVLIEIRNDLIAADAQGDEWAEKLAACLRLMEFEFPGIAPFEGAVAAYDAEKERTYYAALIEAAKRGENHG